PRLSPVPRTMPPAATIGSVPARLPRGDFKKWPHEIEGSPRPNTTAFAGAFEVTYMVGRVSCERRVHVRRERSAIPRARDPAVARRDRPAHRPHAAGGGGNTAHRARPLEGA